MKAYFFVCGGDAAEFSNDALMSIQNSIKSPESFIGVSLTESYSLQMRPSTKRGWNVEFLNTDLLNLRWTNIPKRKARSLLTSVLKSSDPIKLMERLSGTWKRELLSVDKNGHVSG